MKIVQINENDYVEYTLVNDNTEIMAEAYVNNIKVGELIFNVGQQIEEHELESFTIREAMNTIEYFK